jgi:hypothetical protein
MCLGGDIGASLDLSSLRNAAKSFLPSGEQGSDTLILFGETNGCLAVEVEPAKAEAFETIFSGFPCKKVGKATAEKAVVVHERAAAGERAVAGDREPFHASLAVIERAFRAETAEALREAAFVEKESARHETEAARLEMRGGEIS